MMMMLRANIHLKLLIHWWDCTARRSFPNKKKYSPESLKQHALSSALSIAWRGEEKWKSHKLYCFYNCFYIGYSRAFDSQTLLTVLVSGPNYKTSLPAVFRAAQCTCPFHLIQYLCLTSLPPLFTVKTSNPSIDSCVIPHLTRGTMSSGSQDLSAAAPPSVWIWICLPDIKSQLVQQKSHLARTIVSLLWGCNWSSLYTAISFKLYLAGPAKSALLRCHFITHSLAVCAHVAPGSWSMAVSLLHQQRSSFLTRTEI